MSIKQFHEALFYSATKSGVCKCDLCPRNCVILPAKNQASLQKENVGFCGTRINLNGNLFAVNFGRVTCLATDPVEKKPLYHFLPGDMLLSFGSFGCNFRCSNCHNWEISQTSTLIHNRPAVLESLSDGFAEISPAEIVSQAVEHDCSGIAYTYNEPTVFLEFALEVMKLAKKARLKNVWVTNGFFSDQVWAKIYSLVDAFNIDVKSFDQHFYQSHCKASISPVIRNLKKIYDSGVHLEITTLIIPGLNDKENVLHGIATFISKKLSVNVPWHLIDFSAPISWQMQNWRSADKLDVKKAYDIGVNEGLRYVYSNIISNGTDTVCPHCGELNIKRNSYEVERYDDNGSCFKCGQKLSIVC